MTAPGIFPWIEFSIVGAGTWLMSCVVTTETALAAFWDETVVATPVTTCVWSRRTSLVRLIVYSVLPATIGTLWARKPMRRTVSVLASAGT